MQTNIIIAWWKPIWSPYILIFLLVYVKYQLFLQDNLEDLEYDKTSIY